MGKTIAVSPVQKFLDEVGTTAVLLAPFCLLDDRRFSLLVRGAFDTTPDTLRDVVDTVLGPGEGVKLEADYQLFRGSLPKETREQLEKEMYPAGRAFGTNQM